MPTLIFAGIDINLQLFRFISAFSKVNSGLYKILRAQFDYDTLEV
jgi:hypothetical protein